MKKDYYKILGVSKEATKDDIKKAFHKLAHQYHPDKTGGDDARFKEVSEAYQTLSDERKRAEYDTYGSTFAGSGGPQGGFGGFDFSGFQQGFNGTQGFEGVEFDLGDIFGEFFGGGSRKKVRRGRDIAIDLEIPFAESIFGTERTMLIAKTMLCSECQGSGGRPGAKMQKCATCNGQGRVHEARRTILGSIDTVKECSVCRGKGEVPAEKCAKCRGAGAIKGQEEIHVVVPPGVNNGEMIRMTGKGEVSPGGISGDLYVKLHVTAHKTFRREGTNLAMELDVKLSDALLGGEYKVATLDGDITVKVPEGVSHGDVLRVRGKGAVIEKGKRGDLLIKANVKIPKKLSKKAHEAVEALRAEGV